jgi:hypothetical protein
VVKRENKKNEKESTRNENKYSLHSWNQIHNLEVKYETIHSMGSSRIGQIYNHD